MRTLHSIPIAHRHDPISSHEAARKLTNRSAQCTRVLSFVEQSPGHTGAELAHLYGMDVYAVRRRLSDLKELGKVYQEDARLCTVSGRRSVLWYPVYAQGELL